MRFATFGGSAFAKPQSGAPYIASALCGVLCSHIFFARNNVAHFSLSGAKNIVTA
jgi:hypothetical protein